MGIIEMNNVTYRYEGADHDVIKNITLSVKEGEFVCLLGQNASGKSTLAKLINGLFLPTEGAVLVDGLATDKPENTLAVRSRAGMVFQNPDNQMVAGEVEEDVAFGCENLGIPHAELQARVDAALSSVNMLNYAHVPPHKLSGGQKQRVAIAGIIAMEPKVLILDEATAMLDPRGRKEVLETAKRLNREKGITVIYITHFMEEAIDADRVIILSKGTVRLDGTPKEVFADEKMLEECFLELPAAAKTARELAKKGLKIDGDVLSVEELSKQICQYL